MHYEFEINFFNGKKRKNKLVHNCLQKMGIDL